MDKLKKFLELGKLHYEKVLLVLVVLGLGVAVGFLYYLTGKVQEEASQITGTYEKKKVKAPPPLDLAPYRAALAFAKNPPGVQLSLPHKVFTPVKWVRAQDGRIIADRSGKSVGPDALKIDLLKALNTVVRFVGSSPDGYVVEFLAEAADRPEFRKARSFTMPLEDKIGIPGGTAKSPNQLWLREVKGAKETPDQLVFEFTKTKERITISKDKAFVRADAYLADLTYPPENRQFKGLRRDAVISFGGEEYKIVEITENEVVISNRLNEKKTRLKRTP